MNKKTAFIVAVRLYEKMVFLGKNKGINVQLAASVLLEENA
jgi:small basic protein